MAESVKGTRRYHSPRRAEQAATTRLRLLEAAERRFAADGYAQTSMAEIAREADVGARTVYVVFETKSGLLRALWHLRLRGDEDAAPVGARDWFRAVLDEPDPATALRRNAENAAAVRRRVGPLLRVIRDAAPADPEAGALWRRIQAEFLANQREVVAALDRRGALREELDADVAADILWTVNNPDVYLLLVGQRGWTLDAFTDWVAETSRAQLLRR